MYNAIVQQCLMELIRNYREPENAEDEDALPF